MKIKTFRRLLLPLLPLAFLAACDGQEKPVPTGKWWIAPDCEQQHEHKGYLPVFAGHGPCLVIEKDAISFMTEEGSTRQETKFKYNSEDDSWTGILQGAAGVRLSLTDHDSMMFENLAGVTQEYRRSPRGRRQKAVDLQPQKAAELYEQAISLTDRSKADPELEGKLIHATGKLKCFKPVVDETLGTIANCLGLFAIVEKYGPSGKTGPDGKPLENIWQQVKGDMGDKAKNLSQKINSQYLNLNTGLIYSDDVRLGEWKVPREFLESACGSRPVDIMASNAPVASIKAGGGKITGNTIYLGQDPDSPAVGDLRVRYFYIPDSVTVTIVGTLKDGAFASYQIDDKKAIGRLFMGKVPLRIIF